MRAREELAVLARLVVVVVAAGIASMSVGHEAQVRNVSASARTAGGEPASGSSASGHASGPAQGEAVFQRVCAACHLSLSAMTASPAAAANSRAVPRELLRRFTPEAVLNALTNGRMQAQGALLTADERHAVAEYASGSSFENTAPAPQSSERNLCKEDRPMHDPSEVAGWNGWGNGPANTRFQPESQGKLTAADLPRLELKWAFGYANVSSARAQPVIAGGRLFTASESGEVHALDPKAGCTYWVFKARAGVPTAPVVGAYTNASGKIGYAVYFGDRRAGAYAVDAQTGRQLWVRKVDEHPSAAITGTPAVYGGRVLVPVQGLNEEGQGGYGTYPCCTFRGSVAALDASTGAVIWKTYTVDESRPRGVTSNGVQTFGPAGGSIWSSPTVDAKRRLVYVATGNGYAEPSQPTTDAIIALDIDTGAIKWVRQMTANDTWTLGCGLLDPHNPACPAAAGPDYDFSAPPLLAAFGGRELLLLPQKSGIAWALDPDNAGNLVWQFRFGRGSGLGGQWGMAVEGGRVFVGTADLLAPQPGGMHALSIADGRVLWHVSPQPALCGNGKGCSTGQGGPITAIPGAALSAGMDGGLRAYASSDGRILWTFDTNREFDTINGVKAHGGGMDAAGPVVADGMLYVTSGTGGLRGLPGNVLLAFGVRR